MQCPRCHANSEEGSGFCRQCGCPLNSPPMAPVPQKDGVRTLLIVLICVVSAALVGVLVWIGIELFAKSPQDMENPSTVWIPSQEEYESLMTTRATTATAATTATTTTTAATTTTTVATTTTTQVRDTRSEFVFYDSDRRHLRESEYNYMDADTLMTAINEIYARHGRLFNDQEIQAYFNSLSWYRGTVPPEQFDMAVFNEYENANLQRLIDAQRALNVR